MDTIIVFTEMDLISSRTGNRPYGFSVSNRKEEEEEASMKNSMIHYEDAMWIGWSAENSLLACYSKVNPQHLWVWNAADGRLSTIIVALERITCAQWKPVENSGRAHPTERCSLLAFCTNTARVYFYDPSSRTITTESLPHGNSFGIKSLTFNSDSTCLLLQGNESLVTLTGV